MSAWYAKVPHCAPRPVDNFFIKPTNINGHFRFHQKNSILSNMNNNSLYDNINLEWILKKSIWTTSIWIVHIFKNSSLPDRNRLDKKSPVAEAQILIFYMKLLISNAKPLGSKKVLIFLFLRWPIFNSNYFDMLITEKWRWYKTSKSSPAVLCSLV
jgi:hypothetical protein